MTRSSFRLMAAIAAVAAMLTACASDTRHDSRPWDQMYCQLIHPQSVQPLIDAHHVEQDDVKDFGGPGGGVPGLRNISCSLATTDAVVLLSTAIAEGPSDYMVKQHAFVEDQIAKYRNHEGAHLSTIDNDGTFGYAHYIPKGTGAGVLAYDSVAGTLLVDGREITFSMRADADHAAELSTLVLQIGQEMITNLDLWDADHPS